MLGLTTSRCVNLPLCNSSSKSGVCCKTNLGLYQHANECYALLFLYLLNHSFVLSSSTVLVRVVVEPESVLETLDTL